MKTQTIDTVIIGAGLSGLTTGYRLKQAGESSFIILEAKNRVGGRTINQTGPGGLVIDGGAEYIGPSQYRVKALAEELGITLFPTYDTGRTVFVAKGKRSEFSGLPFFKMPLVSLDFMAAFLQLEWKARSIDAERPWTYKNAATLDNITLSEWLDKHVHTYSARLLFDIIIAQTLGGDPHNVSVLWTLDHIKNVGGLQQLIATKGGAQEWRCIEGTWEMSRRMQEKIAGHIQLSSPVEKIDWNSRGVVVHTSRGTIEAKRVIVAMNAAEWNHITFSPELPKARQGIADATMMIKDLKAHIIYERPFWREKGLNGGAMSDTGTAPVIVDNTHPNYPYGVLMGFLPVGVRRIKNDEELADFDTRKQAVIDSLVRYFGEEAAHPLDYIEQDWRHDAYTEGCIPALAPGALTKYGPELQAADGPIIWSGSESSHVWASYMDGAVRTGEQAAQIILGKQTK